MRRCGLPSWWALGLCLLNSAVAAATGGASELRPDEQVILYPALGRAVAGGWELNLHGIVYQPARHRVLTKLMRRALGIDEGKLTLAEKAVFRERAAYFFVDDKRGRQLSLSVAGRSLPLGTSEADGHFEALALFVSGELPAAPAATSLCLPGSIATRGGGRRELKLELEFLEDKGLSVISDIDDTIKISDVRKKPELAMNTFCRSFRPVPGMAEVYGRWARAGARFHYVSASPWQLYLPLSEFTRSNGFPAGTFHLKSVRVKDTTFFSLFTSPERYKPPVIEELFRLFPNRRYVLVGDSGEKDPEIYGALARKHPRQVRKIFIRDVTDEAGDAARFEKAFRDLPGGLWEVFTAPGQIQWSPTVLD